MTCLANPTWPLRQLSPKKIIEVVQSEGNLNQIGSYGRKLQCLAMKMLGGARYAWHVRPSGILTLYVTSCRIRSIESITYGSAIIALYMVLLSSVHYCYQFVSAMLKICKHGCIHYYILFCGEEHSKLLHLSTLRAYFIATHICCSNIHFSDLQKFTLSTCSEKLEVRYNDAVTCLWSLSYSVTI